MKFLSDHMPFLEAEYEDSTETALLEEVAHYDIQGKRDASWQGIDVCTDARHGHRKNAKDTSMIAIGHCTKKSFIFLCTFADVFYAFFKVLDAMPLVILVNGPLKLA